MTSDDAPQPFEGRHDGIRAAMARPRFSIGFREA